MQIKFVNDDNKFLFLKKKKLKKMNFVKLFSEFKGLKGAGKTTYLFSASFCYGNGYLASYPDLT
jgi:hypothetical protein